MRPTWVCSALSHLSMYNFGVQVVKEMEDKDREFLEQNIQMAIQQGQIDLEDAMAVRSLKDVNQAERLLIRRKKRMQEQQQMAAELTDAGSAGTAAAQAASQAKQQELQMEAQFKQQGSSSKDRWICS